MMAVVEIYVNKILTDNQKEIVDKLSHQELQSFVEIVSSNKSITSIDENEVERLFVEKYHATLKGE